MNAKDDRSMPITRRSVTRLLGGALGSTLARTAYSLARPASNSIDTEALTPPDAALLDEMERAGCLYFLEQADASTGQVLDRALNRARNGRLDQRRASSIAATGFGLTALSIADSRGYFAPADIRRRVLSTLKFHLNEIANEHGFFYHFNDIATGKRMWRSEVSSIDTAILLCGILTCRSHFAEPEIKDLATRIYNRVDWPWMLNGGKTFSMGWHPESGFVAARWDHYSELMMIYLLAIGSPTHPVAASCWDAFSRPHVDFFGFNYLSGRDPLFVHQYSHAWFDFAHKRDAYADYFANSIAATRAHKAFCLRLGLGYNDDFWGVSASDSQKGYVAWGGPPVLGSVDGSVVPYAAAGSLPFLPADCMRVLRSLRSKYGKQAWGRYGFCDAFLPSQGWYDADVLGIDLGITVLMAENLRTQFVWRTFMNNPEPPRAMKMCGFSPI